MQILEYISLTNNASNIFKEKNLVFLLPTLFEWQSQKTRCLEGLRKGWRKEAGSFKQK